MTAEGYISSYFQSPEGWHLGGREWGNNTWSSDQVEAMIRLSTVLGWPARDKAR